MDKRSDGGKIILGMLKGKPMTTSVPSMAIRFNASAEEIEDFYTNEDEQSDHVGDSILPIEKSTEPESSPRRSILPLLGKRSTSIDTSTTNAQDASPPSDPWRFLSDIKGKITKSVEGKLTEYKSRTQDSDGSPKITKPIKDSKENSSLSDSEEVSESSISRTCGIVSTTEGVEMSSDDETPSLSEEDKLNNDNTHSFNSASSIGLRQRFRLVNKKSTQKEGLVGMDFLENIQKISDGITGQETSEIESGVDVLADLTSISNFQVDNENVLNINQVSGSDIRNAEFGGSNIPQTVFSPSGFVDLRRPETEENGSFNVLYSLRAVIFTAVALCIYFSLPLPLYFSGFIAGGLAVSVVWSIYVKIYFDTGILKPEMPSINLPILEIPAAKEYLPLRKFEGWVNEYPDEYNPLTYHISQTQSVYLRLQGNFLKISHTRQKIPKRAMWNEPEHKLVFTRHRIYNLLGAKVTLLPDGLAKIRHWSKKYPICIKLNKDQVSFEESVNKVKEHKGKEIKVAKKSVDSVVERQVFSKLVENADESEHSVISQGVEECEDIYEQDDAEDMDLKLDLDNDDDDDFSSNILEWQNVTSESVQDSPDETRIYIFGRTDREKEDWFRRLRLACNKSDQDEPVNIHDEYMSYMKMNKVIFGESDNEQVSDGMENIWVNALIARVLFDCVREQLTIQRIKERIQRKLASIRLPHFIQELYCEELNLGTSAPMILGSSKPVLNDRGLWLDLDISYEGLVVVILQTKVNLLKLKQPHCTDDKLVDGKPAMFHSDVDDSAESTTDEEPSKFHAANNAILDSKGYPVPGLGGSSNRSKKLMKMVDRIAESKFFQAATEYKYIKKAMQEFSNTDLRLKVELKKCVGKLVLNIPTPPSDRVWLGFRVPPELLISAHPIVGDRNISFMHVTNWIEKKIYKEFQKIFVIPNMEDLLIPVMSPKLPE